MSLGPGPWGAPLQDPGEKGGCAWLCVRGLPASAAAASWGVWGRSVSAGPAAAPLAMGSVGLMLLQGAVQKVSDQRGQGLGTKGKSSYTFVCCAV